MATVSKAQLYTRVTVTETLDSAPAASGSTVTSEHFNRAVQQLSGTTTPPVTKYAGWEPVIPVSSSGTMVLTVDLTSLPGTQGAASINGTGLKVQMLRLYNPTTNTQPVIIGPSVANGYDLFGTGNEVEVPVGAELFMSFRDTLPNVSGSAKSLDLTGEDGETYELEILLG